MLGTEGAGAGRGPGRWSALAPRLSPVPASAVGGSGVRAARPPRCRVRARPWGCSWLGAAWGEPGSSLPLCPSPKVARPGGRGLGVEGALQTQSALPPYCHSPFRPTSGGSPNCPSLPDATAPIKAILCVPIASSRGSGTPALCFSICCRSGRGGQSGSDARSPTGARDGGCPADVAVPGLRLQPARG